MKRITAVVGCLVVVFAALVAQATPPTWEGLRSAVFATRLGWFAPVDESYNGIWSYDPESDTFQRVRPFLSTMASDAFIHARFKGGDGFLAAHGDVLTFTTWPMQVDFDLFSWRLLRRLPASSGALEVGWVVQGPTLLESEADVLGLPAGTYGIGRCVLQVISEGGGTLPRFCGPDPYPGVGDPGQYGDDGVVLARASWPGFAVTHVASAESYDWQVLDRYGGLPLGLSLDVGRGGFWRPTPTGAQLLQVANGVFAQPRPVEDLSDVIGSEAEVSRLFYHEASGTMLGTAFSTAVGDFGGNRRFFRWDPSTGDGEILEWWPGTSDAGAPDTFAAVRDPPSQYLQTVPIVGGGPGRNGTDWRTELWLYNPSPESTAVSIRRVTRPDSSQSIVLPGHASLEIADALAWLGGGQSGDGTAHEALVVSSTYSSGFQLRVDGRISTPEPGGVGRYGHGVAAVPGTLGYSNHLPERVLPWNDNPYYISQSPGIVDAYLDLDLREAGRYRYNVGVVNDDDTPLHMTFVWGSGQWQAAEWAENVRTPDTIREVTIDPHTVEVVALLELFPPSVTQHWAPRIGVVGSRPTIVWLSMVDNLTGDATFVPYTNLGWGNDILEDTLVLPVVARIPGAEGSRWTTDLIGYHFTWDDSDVVVVRYWPESPTGDCGAAGGVDQGVLGELGIAPAAWAETLGHGIEVSSSGWRRVIPDVISHLDGCTADATSKGALEISTITWNSGFSRTYTTRGDGGTFGGMLPLYPPHGWPSQHFAGLKVEPGQRVNLGLFNGLAEAVTNRLLAYDASGRLAASRDLVLAPHEHRQERLERFVGPLPDGLYGLTVLPLDDPDTGTPGRCWAYVSLVDNATNDPTNLW